MRALLQHRYGGSEVLQLGEAAVPAIGPREVLVRVHGAGLDRGTWHMMTGRPYLMRIMGFGFSAPKNAVVGFDVAGTVVAVGAEVTRFQVGDAVFGIGKGTFAEYAAALEDKLSVKPKALTFEQAAVVPVSGLTALRAVDAARVAAGQRVLIIGASGGVGSFAVQLARARGASVTGVSSTSKLDLVRSLGAEHVLDYTAGDFTAGDARYDVILDAGGNTPLSKLRRVLAPAGTLVFIGGEHGGDWSAGFGRQLLALALSPFVKQKFVMLMNREHHDGLDALSPLLESGQIKSAIDRTWRLEGAVEAMKHLEAGRARGKIAIVP
jgi:NADPH:quinone reductase-like Zn-dependent oxidoreductase